MEVQSILANRIDTAGEMISYDDACKQVIANKVILAWILKSCVQEFRSKDILEIAEKFIEGEPIISRAPVHMDESAEFIQGMKTESASIKEGTLTFDIKFRVIIPETNVMVDMIVNVEAQNNFYPGYPVVKRGVYYASRMISEQYGSVFGNSEYQKIKKVASIWICPNPPEYRMNTITRYSIQEEDLVGTLEESKGNYDLINVVIVCLGGREKDRYSGLLKMLDVLLSQDIPPSVKKKTLQDEFGIPMTKELEGDVERMCNLSEGVYDIAKIEAIKNLMMTTEWDIETCMDALKIPDDKREAYKVIIMGQYVTA